MRKERSFTLQLTLRPLERATFPRNPSGLMALADALREHNLAGFHLD